MDDEFGFSVALEGSVALIGVPNDDDAAQDGGAVHVFRFDGSTWVAEQILTTSDVGTSDRLGQAVDLSGDLAVMGGGLGMTGAFLFFYDASAASWSEQSKLIRNNNIETTGMGHGVAVSGDTVIVGSHIDVDELNHPDGKAYFYRGFEDCNENGILDGCEITIQPDSNSNGISDCEDIASGLLPDCNGNFLADASELIEHWSYVASFRDPPVLRDSVPLAHGVTGGAASLINGKIYVSHGLRINPGQLRLEIENKMSIYDISTDSWAHDVQTTGTTLARKNLGGATALGQHYVIGGEVGFDGNFNVAIANVDVFDPAGIQWIPLAPMPQGSRSGVGCATWNDLIYVAGGRDGSFDSDFDGFGEGTILNRLERFDPQTNSWNSSPLASMLVPVSDCSACIAFNDKIYVFGGATAPFSSLNITQIYDIVNDSWSIGAPMPTPRGAALAGLLGNKIVVSGGRTTSGQNLNIAEFYDPVSDSWEPEPIIMLVGSGGMAAGATWDESGIYSIGADYFGDLSTVVQKLNPALSDCNVNNSPDVCDMTDGISSDCNFNNIPDECDPDCNGNGIPDFCDIVSGLAIDCNFNGIPDRCEVKQCRADITPLCPPQPSTPDVNIDDLVAVLNAFGPCAGCPEDFMPDFDPNAVPAPLAAGDGVVDIDELVAVLNNFGPCTPGGNGATAITLVQMDFSNGFMFADGTIDAASASLVSAAWVANQAGSSPVDVYRVFAQVSGLTATLTYCGGGTNSGPNGTPEPLVLNPGKGGQFFIPIANTYAPVNVALLSVNGGAGYEYFQSQAYGTFLALGSASNAIMPSKQGNTAGLDAILSGSVNEANAGWSVTPVAGQGVISDGNGGWQVLIGQFAVPAGKTLTVAVRLVGDGIDIYATTNSGVLGGP